MADERFTGADQARREIERYQNDHAWRLKMFKEARESVKKRNG